jgi:hypothetical protein
MHGWIERVSKAISHLTREIPRLAVVRHADCTRFGLGIKSLEGSPLFLHELAGVRVKEAPARVGREMEEE